MKDIQRAEDWVRAQEKQLDGAQNKSTVAKVHTKLSLDQDPGFFRIHPTTVVTLEKEGKSTNWAVR